MEIKNAKLYGWINIKFVYIQHLKVILLLLFSIYSGFDLFRNFFIMTLWFDFLFFKLSLFY
ncbi:hypothetical protein B5C26_09720 [Photorhabdus luminescens]|uniref:Uncharacterized protein n=1 Tax=Photorhabdus luminescens subsp. mexicana TaxID=2100167 RepID=A0A4R4JFR0_PHOLU|nr:hypothetical protein B5C26_09720 [Photorhabdus luminescens]TDB52908.1 hypothetical protein C5468_08135 [Photorhabdus luminescens subsp. mexicana]